MTKQANLQMCLGGSSTGSLHSRFFSLTLAALLATVGAAFCGGQTAPVAAQPDQGLPEMAKPAVKPLAEKKPAAKPAEKKVGGYLVHQSIEVGGRITETSGSGAMWNTLVNQSSGGRVLGQSLELHSINTSKTPFFDSLISSSTGYGGDPYDSTVLKISKGRWYDFRGSFRRDRNYFDYNQLASSLLTNYTATAPVLVAEPDSLHLFNTVRRSTDTNLTLLPLSFISFRAGFNHGTHEGPSYSTLHRGGDVQLLQWFRNSIDTFTAGVDLKLAKRTTLSYDQFLVYSKDDTTFQLTGANYSLSDGTKVSLGVNVLGGTATCGSAATSTTPSTRGPEFTNGIVNPYCSATISESMTAPTRTSFPTEQIRFSSHYWDPILINGRFLYSGATSKVDSFNQSFLGFARGNLRAEVETGAGTGGQFANNKRINTSGDLGLVAEVNKYLSITDSFSYWSFRNNGNSTFSTVKYTGTSGSIANGIPATSILTPLSSITPVTTTTTVGNLLNQQIEQNTLLATVTILPEFRMSAGWRFKNREIVDTGDDLVWHENGLLLGAVLQPNRMVRINLNFEGMNSKSANADTLSNTFTREAPNRFYRIQARATIKPTSWLSFAIAGNNYTAKNTDPMVNHQEHNHDFSFGTTVALSEKLSFDFNYAYDEVYSRTDICYAFTANSHAPLPTGASNSGVCAVAISGSASYLLGTGLYNAPTNFYSGSVNYAPNRLMRFNVGARLNDVDGSTEQINPLMVPGALKSRYVTPYSDVLFNIAPQWAWHGNWTYNGYGETGPASTTLPLRNVHGSTVTLGVKYSF